MMVAPSTAAAPLAPVGAAVRAVTASISPVAPRSPRSPHTLQLDVDGLDQLDDAVLALDERQRITYCNAAAERMYGFRAAEAAGRPFRDLVDGPSNGSARGGTHVGAWLSSGAATHVTTSGRSVPVY